MPFFPPVCLIGTTSSSEQDWIILILKRSKLVTGHKQFDWVKWDYSVCKSSAFLAWEFGSIVLEGFKKQCLLPEEDNTILLLNS